MSQHFALENANLDPTQARYTCPDLNGEPRRMRSPRRSGWARRIVATKDQPVRIAFYNLLPTGADGDLFLPVDSTMMGSGMGPMRAWPTPWTTGRSHGRIRNPRAPSIPEARHCFKDNRATLHLHGGITPWISDGTPHQWITPAGENTDLSAGRQRRATSRT